MKKLLNKCKKVFKRPPDVIIGENYLERWHVIPRNKYFNIYLHKFKSSDDDRAIHDHPWHSVSVMLKGETIEHLLDGRRVVPRFFPMYRPARHLHRLEVVNSPAWTVFITGPRIRDWGFYCEKKGWVHYKDFTNPDDPTSTELGCEGPVHHLKEKD